MKSVDPTTLRAWITDGQELALLDAREEGIFGTGHLFWAVPCPLSRKELRVNALLPRLATRIVCIDGGGGEADTLAGYIAGLGASDVSVLQGGTPAWAAAGNELFSGINVPSKAFGEWVEHHYETRSVDAAELKAWIDNGRDMVVLDSRTLEEFQKRSLPSAISVPVGELVYRIGDLAPDPKTLVVINCAGRTRSIMGAESLRRAGIPNDVVALRNGTMGWELRGLTCEHGRSDSYPAEIPRSAAVARERAAQFADSSGVGVITPARFAQFAADTERTLYVLDVRDPAEFRAGHLAGSISAPGGQLLQETDTWIGVRNARIVLLDDDGVRGRMAATWLRQMGFRDVYVVEGNIVAFDPPAPVVLPTAETIGVADLAALEEQGRIGHDVCVIDFNRSVGFRDGHIPGAIWGLRTRLNQLRPRLRDTALIVATSPDGALARFAVGEMQQLTRGRVVALRGGTEAWLAAGHAVEADKTNPADEDCVDFYLRPYDRNSGVDEAIKEYLAWEIDLPEGIQRDGTVFFGTPVMPC